MKSTPKKKISKKIIFKILASIVVIGGGGAYYLISNNKEGEVKAWMSSSWAYRRGVEVENSGSTTLTNEDVLIEIDTATLITASKMQSDCDDLRFTDSDETTAINYWIESGCNTSTTQVWIRIPSLPAAGKTVYFYYGNDTAVNAETRWPIYLSFGDGGDGNATVSGNKNINTTSVVGRSCADAVNYSVSALGGTTSTTATLTSTPAAGCLSSGDEVLLISQQGYLTAFPNVGNYEIMVIDSISTNVLTFTTLKTKYYGSGSANDSGIGTGTSNQRVMVQRIPNYANVTLNGGVSWYSSTFNSTKGGVFAFKASGTVTISGTIQSSGYGFIGAPARYYGGNGILGGNGGESLCGDGGVGGTNGQHGGAGAAGGGGGYWENPRVYGNGGTGYCGGGGGPYVPGAVGIGSASSGGSGGGGSRNGGGGGAGYGSIGYSGINNLTDYGADGGTNASGNGVNMGGGGGGTYGTADLSKLYFGSGGGGGGGAKINAFTTAYGGAGGGIVLVMGNTVTISGAITSSGGTGGRYVLCNTGAYYGGGGGGSGGSIKIVGDSVTLGTTRVTAGGGSGNVGAYSNTCTGCWGGNGGSGRIRAEYVTSVSGSTSPGASTAQLGPTQSVTIQSEETYNQTPTAPTSLYTEGATNPTQVSDITPEFSAIYNDPDISDTSSYYEIEVNTLSNFTGTVMWDSGKTGMTSTNQGNRSPDLSYAGTPLSHNGSTYHWRIKFWDSIDVESPWASTAQFTMNTAPTAPTDLLTEGLTNPIDITDLTPEFSAIFNDSDAGDTGEYYELEVNTASDFSGTVMWDSTKTSMSSTAIGNRCSDISYDGTTLTLDSTTYYWRIKFWDDEGGEGSWSSTANYTMLGIPVASSLLTDGQTNPTILLSASPYFSAICTDPDADDCLAYEININTLNTFTGTVLWDTGKVSTSITSGNRSSDITYHGTPLTNSESIYYWRIKFWDDNDNEGNWSPTAQFSDFYPSFRFEGLKLEGVTIN